MKRSDKLLNKNLILLRSLKSDDLKININFKRMNINIETNIPFYLSNKDSGLSTDLYTWRFREPIYIFMLHKFFKEYDKYFNVILDVGSNIGYFPYLEHIFTSKTIFAVEPIKDSYTVLERNMSNINNITVLNLAISDNGNKLFMYVPDKLNLARVIDQNSLNRNIVRVKALSLINFIKKYKLNNSKIMLRTDIEGYETKLLRNIPAQITGLTYELHPINNNKYAQTDLLDNILDQGFKIVYGVHHLRGLDPIIKYMGVTKTYSIIRRLFNKKIVYQDKRATNTELIKTKILNNECSHLFLIRK